MKVFLFSEVNAKMLSLAASYDMFITVFSVYVCESLPTLSREKRRSTLSFSSVLQTQWVIPLVEMYVHSEISYLNARISSGQKNIS